MLEGGIEFSGYPSGSIDMGLPDSQDWGGGYLTGFEAAEILVHVTTGTKLKSTDRQLRAAGMRCVGGGYVG